jgi:quercetin dioxygenase-like cupin family protein
MDMMASVSVDIFLEEAVSSVKRSRSTATMVRSMTTDERARSELPPLIRQLPPFEGPFEARRLEAKDCDVLFASYPGDTDISAHQHPSENVCVVLCGELRLHTEAGEQIVGPGQWYHLDPDERHWARFEIESTIIELRFREPARTAD